MSLLRIKKKSTGNPIIDYRHEKISRLEKKIIFILLFIVFGFILTFIPLDKLGIIKDDNISSIMNLAIKAASSAVATLLIGWPLFATDKLATGKSKTSIFFREQYPSALITKRYNQPTKSDHLWFEFFNKWSKPTCDYNTKWHIVIDRTYSCRLIFLLLSILLYAIIFSAIAILSFGIYNYRNNLSIVSFSHLVYFGVVFVAYILLKTSNRIPNKPSDVPTGCWFRYVEISNMEKAILEDEILKAATYDEALVKAKAFQC